MMKPSRQTVVPAATRSAWQSAGGPQPQAKELPDGMREWIAAKAYELWEQRGRREGRDLEDWLNAEAIVMEEIHEARE